MRWLALTVVLGCGSGGGGTQESSPGEAPVALSTPATMEAAAEAEPASGMAAARSSPSAMAPPAPEPVPLPEALREQHDRLVAAIETNENDVSSICALASVLRRAERFSEADARIDEAEAIAANPDRTVELAPGTMEACHYERGRIAEALEDWSMARAGYWRAMKTPIERRRRIVRDAFLRVAKREVESSCDEVSTLTLRALLTLADEPAFRRCLRERERDAPTCEILRRDDSSHPGTSPEDFDEHVTVGDEGAAFGLIGSELYVISVIGGRKQVRLCAFEIPADSRLTPTRVLRLGETELFYVATTNVISYTCECEEGEEGHPDSPADCRCEDVFDIRILVTDRGELRLALIDDYSTEEGMATVDWDEPLLRVPMSGGPSVEGDVLRMGNRLRLRGHVLVPAE